MTHERVCFTTTCTLCQLNYKKTRNVCAAQLAGVIVGRMSSASSCFGDLECHCARATALSHARPQSSAVVKGRGARGGSAPLLRLGPPLLESEPSQWTVTKHTVFTNWC